MKGIDKRTHKDGTVSYRARVRIKGHPVLIQSFTSKTLAMKWKRDTESAVERGTFAYEKPRGRHTLSELIDRYIERVLPTKPKNARNVRQHLLWWKQELGSYPLSDIKPNLISQKRDDLLLSPTCFYPSCWDCARPAQISICLPTYKLSCIPCATLSIKTN